MLVGTRANGRTQDLSRWDRESGTDYIRLTTRIEPLRYNPASGVLRFLPCGFELCDKTAIQLDSTGQIAVSRTDNKRLNAAQLLCALAISAFLSGFIFCCGAQAADLDNAEVKSLDGLETRFFEHTYQKEDTEARLERLEKLIYGEAKTGDQAQRLVTLVSALPKSTDFPADPGDGATKNSSSDANSSAGTNDNSQGSSNNDTQTASTDSAAGDAEDYPKVDAIEQTILGKSFQGVPIAKRLDQLELKAFNRTSQDPDLSERVDKLSEYVQKHMHKSIEQIVDPRTVLNYQSNGNADDGGGGDNVRTPAYVGSPGGTYGAGNYGGAGGYGGGSGSYGITPPMAANSYAQNQYAPQGSYGRQSSAQPPANAPEAVQVAWLESRVFGQAGNPNVPLIDRLRRLEQSVFPTEQMDANTPISAQIKLLVNAVELMHNSNPGQATAPGQSPYGYQPAQQAQGSGQYPYQEAVTQNATSAGASNFPSWPPQGAASQNQYSTYSANANQTQPGAYPYQNAAGTDGNTTQYEQQLNQQTSQQQQPEQHQSQGHPLLKGLAHALMSVGTMAASSNIMMGGMGMGGMGMGGMGMGNMMGGYGNYGTGMMPGYGGMGGMGRGFGGIHF